MPVGGSDFGTLPPAGTDLDLRNVWADGNWTFRSGSSLTVSSTAGVTTQSLNGTGTAPTLAAVAAGAGTGSTVGSQKGHDLGGSFVLTTAGTPAAGPVATVTFGTALAAAPVSVVVSAVDTTGSPILTVDVGAGAFSATGFSIVAGALTTAHTYLISYQVVAS
jgi:hypothetical protein